MIIVNILASNSKESNQQTNMDLTQLNLQNTIRGTVVTKTFKRPKTMIEETYYNRILEKMYKENIHNPENQNVIRVHSSNIKKSIVKKANAKPISNINSNVITKLKETGNKLNHKTEKSEAPFDEGIEDSCNIFILYFLFLDYSDEDKEITIELDNFQYREISMILQNYRSNYEKFYNLCETPNKITVIKEKINATYNKEPDENIDLNVAKINKCIMWDYQLMIENIKFCTVPRFLIVEVKFIFKK